MINKQKKKKNLKENKTLKVLKQFVQSVELMFKKNILQWNDINKVKNV